MNENAVLGCLGCFGCFGLAVLFIALYIAIGALFAWIFEWVWNLLVPTLLHGPRIDYALACALYIVLSLAGGLFHASQGRS